MDIGEKIKKIREAKGLSQKEVAATVGMDQSQYSKIEKGKTDPTTTTLQKISGAIGVSLAEIFAPDDVFKDVDSYDRSLLEKLQLLEQLEEDEKQSVFKIIDSLVSKKRLKDSLSSALNTA